MVYPECIKGEANDLIDQVASFFDQVMWNLCVVGLFYRFIVWRTGIFLGKGAI